MRSLRASQRTPGWAAKLWQVNRGLALLLCVVAAVGFAMLYSAANGSLDPWASRQMSRFAVGLVVMLVVAVVNIQLWFRYAYVIYVLALGLLVAVEILGAGAMGAQRWLSLGFVRIQPAEVMKVALVLALARYFHAGGLDEVRRLGFLIVPAALVAVPALLMLRQPDLGTAIMLTSVGAAMFFVAGVRPWVFVAALVAGLGSLPVLWTVLRDYQKQRILTFLNPESDALGAGYHVLQSKIALGSGGMFGKGFMQGTQAHLNFLPERQTDFIFTMLAEEFGIVGGLGLIALYVLLLIYGFAIALRSRNQFGRLLALGVTANFFMYVFINISMVMGIIPVVGVPLPLISYGGTAMLAVLFGFGLLSNVWVHRDTRISRSGDLATE